MKENRNEQEKFYEKDCWVNVGWGGCNCFNNGYKRGKEHVYKDMQRFLDLSPEEQKKELQDGTIDDLGQNKFTEAN